MATCVQYSVLSVVNFKSCNVTLDIRTFHISLRWILLGFDNLDFISVLFSTYTGTFYLRPVLFFTKSSIKASVLALIGTSIKVLHTDIHFVRLSFLSSSVFQHTDS